MAPALHNSSAVILDDEIWWGNMLGSIIDDTSKGPQPEVGTFWRSFADTVEIIAVSPPMEREVSCYDSVQGHHRKTITDRAVRFRVVAVHSPEDSGMHFTDERILWGDMIHENAYVRVDWKPPPKTEDLIGYLIGCSEPPKVDLQLHDAGDDDSPPIISCGACGMG